MPTYCFTSPAGKTIERRFAIKDRPESIELEDGTVAKRDLAAEWRGIKCNGDWKPIECYASGVAPQQAQELRDFFSRHGESVEVTRDGNPIYTSASQRKRLLKLRGFVDKNSYY